MRSEPKKMKKKRNYHNSSISSDLCIDEANRKKKKNEPINTVVAFREKLLAISTSCVVDQYDHVGACVICLSRLWVLRIQSAERYSLYQQCLSIYLAKQYN